ncbi:serine hydrolase [Microbulbifer sp. A4B17]|uniref:serine hydrolase domain-containing protein n=1 Tax=Microbulbifer sp. A4B17 TaxID=359370 RepID=UPI001EDCFEFE|nr:serine hydrolase domain-containing protein [Microbulbifer sp. A4B17]
MAIAMITCHSVFAKEAKHASVLQVMEDVKEEYGLPSLSVAVGIKNEVVFSEANGLADIGQNRPANSHTQYSIGSLAKPMTGLAIARLVDSGKVTIQAPVSTYVEKAEYTALFSVAELAAHIAGVPHDTPERDLAEFTNVRDHKSPLDAFYVFDTHSLLFESGTEYHYSSNGYILLSAVVKKASGHAYVEYLRSDLWDKLDMSATELDTSAAGKENEASYFTTRNDNGLYMRSTTKRDRSFLFGGGGFISTPTDLVKMARSTYGIGYLQVSHSI